MKILKSKLQIPILRNDWIERNRLTDRFLRSEKTRLIVLQAPAGFGKTTITRQFLEKQKKNKVAWLHLESLDSDPRRFTAYIVEALSNIYPSLKQSELVRGVDDNSKPLTDLHDDLLFMLEEINDSAGWLVLDNWEDVDCSTQVRDLVYRIISLDNTDLRVLIATRKPLSLKTGKLRTEGKAILLTEKDLAFNLYECETVIHKQTGKAVDSELLEHLWQATLGWCVSVNLYLQRLESSSDIPSLRSASNNNKNTLDVYIDEEILGRIDSELSDFVIRCSVLDSISLESASVVCKDNCNIKSAMIALSSSCLPHTSLNNGLELRLHPLFRQAANKILHTKYSHKEVIDIYKKASEYFIGQDRVIDAIESQSKVGDSKGILTLIETHWYELIAANGITRIDTWFETVSHEMRTDPLYIDLYSRALIQKGNNQNAIAYLSTNLDRERFKYEIARLISLKTRYHWARINTDPDPAYDKTLQELTSLINSDASIENSVLAGVEVVLCATSYMELRLNESISHAKMALELIGDTLPEYRFSIQDNLAILEHTCGNSEKALALFNDGINYCKANNSFSGVPLRSYNMAWIHASIGNYRTALQLIKYGRDIVQRYGFKDVYSQMYADRYEGVIRWYIGEHQKSYRLLNRALALAKEHNPKEHLEIAIALDYCKLMSGKTSSDVIETVVPTKGTKRETRLTYIGMQAYLKARAHKTEAVSEYACEMDEIASECGLLPWQIHASFLQSLVSDLQGNSKLCQDQLKKGLTIMEQIKWSSFPMTNELLSAFVYVSAIRFNILPNVAAQLVTSDFRIDLAPTFIEVLRKSDIPKEKERLIKAAAELNIRGLRSTLKELTSKGEAEVENLVGDYLTAIRSSCPLPLRITTLGSFEVVQDGRPVKFARRTSLRLFQWLLTVYPSPLHREVIIDYLWPDVSAEKGSVSLRTTTKDIRKALDPSGEMPPNTYIVTERDHYSLKLADNSYVDCIAILDGITKAEQLLSQGTVFDSQPLEDTLRNAISLYEGEFLPMQLYEQFAVEKREVILSKYQRATLLFAELMISLNRMKEAVAVLKNALKMDSLWGDGVYLLIKTLAQNGNIVEAMRAFRDYELKLETELQIEPDTNLVELYHQLYSTAKHE